LRLDWTKPRHDLVGDDRGPNSSRGDIVLLMLPEPNQPVETNRRPAPRFRTGREDRTLDRLPVCLPGGRSINGTFQVISAGTEGDRRMGTDE
jgi:hypothetical protein